MNAKAVLGALLLFVGLFAAIATIVGVGRGEPYAQTSPVDQRVVGDQNVSDRAGTASIILPVVAGITLAGGAFLLGIGIGAVRRPTIVPPHSPQESRAETTRPLR